MYPVLNSDVMLKLQPNNECTVSIKNESGMHSHNLNDSACSILMLCNGERSIDEIVSTLCAKYSEERMKVFEFVNKFIYNLQKYNIVNVQQRRSNAILDIRGSIEFYTPQVLSLELTQKCPLRCIHCYIDAGAGINLDSEKAEEICNEIIELGIQAVQLTGGEPLMHPGIGKIIKRLCTNRVQVIINTSGMINDDKIFEGLKMLRESNGYVQVSIDGLKDSHNHIRQNKYSFDNAIYFIKKAVKEGIKVCVATCVIDQSYEELEELCNELVKMDIFEYRLGRVSELGRAKENEIKLTLERHKFVLSTISRLNEKYKTEYFKIATVEELDGEGYNKCGAGYKILRIRPNLDITPCVMSDLKIGSLAKESLTEHCRKNSNIFYEICSPNKTVCKDCDHYFKCDHCLSQGITNMQFADECHWHKQNSHILSKFQ